MNRCASALLAASLSVLLAASSFVSEAQTLTRRFPQKALRGEIAFGDPPLVTVNGQPGRLSAGARIRAVNNLIVTTGSVTGTRFIANYTLDAAGQVFEVWMLREDEAGHPWPRTQAEAEALIFDSATQSWSRP